MTPTPIVPEAKATISVQTLALHMGVSTSSIYAAILAPEPRPTDRLVATIADQVAAIGALRKDIRELTGLLQTVVEELTR